MPAAPPTRQPRDGDSPESAEGSSLWDLQYYQPDCLPYLRGSNKGP